MPPKIITKKHINESIDFINATKEADGLFMQDFAQSQPFLSIYILDMIEFMEEIEKENPYDLVYFASLIWLSFNKIVKPAQVSAGLLERIENTYLANLRAANSQYQGHKAADAQKALEKQVQPFLENFISENLFELEEGSENPDDIRTNILISACTVIIKALHEATFGTSLRIVK